MRFPTSPGQQNNGQGGDWITPMTNTRYPDNLGTAVGFRKPSCGIDIANDAWITSDSDQCAVHITYKNNTNPNLMKTLLLQAYKTMLHGSYHHAPQFSILHSHRAQTFLSLYAARYGIIMFLLVHLQHASQTYHLIHYQSQALTRLVSSVVNCNCATRC